MPLRDHFRPPVASRNSWDGFHGQWPAMIVQALARRLPPNYVAAPHVHLGSLEVDIAAFEEFDRESSYPSAHENSGGAATAVWAPTRPTLAFETDLPDLDEYEVRIYDDAHGRELVAVIEIVSPANKDRPEHRRAFVAKCAALLQNRVSVTIVDLVTTREFNLYNELLQFIGHENGAASDLTWTYASACRGTKKGKKWLVETWDHPLIVGRPLPTLPLWLSDDFALRFDLEECYEETCRVLRIR